MALRDDSEEDKMPTKEHELLVLHARSSCFLMDKVRYIAQIQKGEKKDMVCRSHIFQMVSLPYDRLC